MSLWDTDQSSPDRSSPILRAGDVLEGQRFALPHSTLSPRDSSSASNAGSLTLKNNRLVANDGSTNIGLIGFDSNGNMVVKIARTGFDASVAANSNLIFNSSNDVLRVAGVNTTSIKAANFGPSGNAFLTQLATGIVDLTPYGVTNPMVLVSMLDSVGEHIPLTYYSFSYETGALNWQAVGRVSLDGSTLFIEVRAAAGIVIPQIDFIYYVLQQTGAS